MVWILLFGLAYGSFLGVVLARRPRRLSVLYPPSHCPHCRRRLAFWELVPVLGFLAVRGRCRTCGTAIGWWQPALEVATAAALAGAGWAGGPLAAAAAALLLLAMTLRAAEGRAARGAGAPGPVGRSDQGSLLVELVVAGLLTAILATTVFGSAATVTAWLVREQQRQAAVALARAKMEELRGQAGGMPGCGVQRFRWLDTAEGMYVAWWLTTECADLSGAPLIYTTVSVRYIRHWFTEGDTPVILAMIRRREL